METAEQTKAIENLERQGWEFANWISAHDPSDPSAQVAVLKKRPSRHTTHYREVNPDGSVI